VSDVKGRGKVVRIFLNRNLLTKALKFGLTKVETIDALSPLRFSNGGRQMIVMPTRPNLAPAPTPQSLPEVPATQTEPTPPIEPPFPKGPEIPEQPERKPMPEQPGNNTNETPRSNPAVATPPALETALAQIEIVRGDFRSAIAGLNKLADALKQAQREQKTNDKEIQSVRATIRSLQTVRI
jgi:outer membrane biosynthesis protein TonB